MIVSNPEKIGLTRLIQRELIRLQIFPSILGHHYLVYVIEQVALDPLKIKGITKCLYPEIARDNHTNWHAVERDVRNAIVACWTKGGREVLDEMAGCHLTQRPSAKEFISIVAVYISTTYCQ